ncbi:hypothetical protein U6A24_19220 [Aquimarina gracilis]|uniref:Uncharacterized protein n=1 Tax=Aquimarina gracilis TaxID=874422 RepID=A0ABU6A0J0_9FLAO|nr:hypothetical protein [Aquimarina gracilis]MEB3347616.1 hypothetical protein [Aquimarina gracilis]
MEKSIENIWKEGFLNQESILAPKIEALYNKKSMLLVEKIKQTYKNDNQAIIPIAIIGLLGCLYFGKIALGAYLFLLLISLFYLNKRALNPLEKLELNTSSYTYLVSYKNCIRNIIKSYTKVFAFAAPFAVAIGCLIYFKDVPWFQEMISNQEIGKTLLVSIGCLLMVSLLFTSIYRVTTELMYGNYLRNLNAIISDLEELQK